MEVVSMGWPWVEITSRSHSPLCTKAQVPVVLAEYQGELGEPVGLAGMGLEDNDW